MKDIIKEFIELCESFDKFIGFDDHIITIISFFTLLIGFSYYIIGFSWKGLKWCYQRRNQKILNNNLNPFYSNSDVKKATKSYISTKYQNVDPSEDEEPGKHYIATAREKLIPLFFTKVFKNVTDDNKYYIILADSGMGKTTFMINLYLQYKKQNIYPWKIINEIKLYPLGDPEIIENIKKIDNKKNTILLLDAFDESIHANENYENYMKAIINSTKEFRIIIITCRTQFFPSKKEEPHETGYITYGDDRKKILFQKLYVSVFNNKDINRFLINRFNIIFNPFNLRSKKYRRARKIIKQSKNLMCRPMLLASIGDLIDSNKNYDFTYQIYETLIEKWIQRESSKPNIEKKYGNEKKYQELLYDFSKKLALNIYDKRDERGGYFISKDDNIINENNFQISDIEDFHSAIDKKDKESKSLLNRNAEGFYKFSHKSILEYFLAINAFEDKSFLSKLNFEGMDAAKRFYNEKYFVEYLFPNLKKLEGEYSTDNNKTKILQNLAVNESIKTLFIKELKYIEIDSLSCIESLRILKITDNVNYPCLYILYNILYHQNQILINYELLKKLKENESKLKEITENINSINKDLNVFLTELSEFDVNDLIEHLKHKFSVINLSEENEYYNFLKHSIIRNDIQNEINNYEKGQNFMDLLKFICKETNIELSTEMQSINRLICELKKLQNKKGNCSIIY